MSKTHIFVLLTIIVAGVLRRAGVFSAEEYWVFVGMIAGTYYYIRGADKFAALTARVEKLERNQRDEK